MALLGQLEPEMGTIDVYGSLSYASQVPWVFSGTVRENILFGMEYNDVKYKGTLGACSLNEVRVHLFRLMDCASHYSMYLEDANLLVLYNNPS